MLKPEDLETSDEEETYVKTRENKTNQRGAVLDGNETLWKEMILV